jgi:outer membrane protein TolC
MNMILILLLFQQAIPLDSVLKRSLTTNADIATALHTWQAVEEQADGAGTLSEPMLMFRAFLEPGGEKTWRGFETGIQQDLPWPGMRKTVRTAAELRAAFALETLRETTLQVQHAIRKTYYELVMQQRMIHFEEKQLALMESALSLAKTRIATGKASAAESLMMEITIDDMRTGIAKRKRNLAVMYAEMQALTGFAVQTDTTLPARPASFSNVDFTKVIAGAPRLERARYMEKMAKTDTRMTLLESRPMFTASLGMMKAAPLGVPDAMDNNAMFMPQWNLTIPFFNRQKKAAVRSVKEAELGAAASREQMERMLVQELTAVLSAMEDAAATYETASRNLNRALQIQQIRLQEYASGTVMYDAVSEALRLPFMLESARLEALFAWHTQYSTWISLTGKPL